MQLNWEKELEEQEEEKRSRNRKRQEEAESKAEQIALSFKGRVISNRQQAISIAQEVLNHFHTLGKESAVAFLLDSNNMCRDVNVWFGTRSVVTVPQTEICDMAVNAGANKVIMVHNHTDERAIPSDADVSHAAQLHEMLPVGIELVDDLVWCRNGVKSVLNTHRYKQMIRGY